MHEERSEDDRFDALLVELAPIIESVANTIAWYKRHSRRSMLLFRSSGALVILLSVSVPLLATVEGASRDIALPIIALALAGLTGLNSFFSWHSAWQDFSRTRFSLEHQLDLYRLGITKASHHDDKVERMDMALQAAEDLLNAAGQLAAKETLSFFERVQLPRTS